MHVDDVEVTAATAVNAGAVATVADQIDGLFYGGVLDGAELLKAGAIQGIEQEIAVLRTKLKEQLKPDKGDYRLMLRCMELLVRAVAARYRMTPQHADELGRAAAEMVRQLGEQLAPQGFGDV